MHVHQRNTNCAHAASGKPACCCDAYLRTQEWCHDLDCVSSVKLRNRYKLFARRGTVRCVFGVAAVFVPIESLICCVRVPCMPYARLYRLLRSMRACISTTACGISPSSTEQKHAWLDEFLQLWSARRPLELCRDDHRYVCISDIFIAQAVPFYNSSLIRFV